MARRSDKPAPEREHARWLEQLLTGQGADFDHLTRMVATQDESTFLDFKRADFAMPDPERCRRETAGDPVTFYKALKKWISGFANARGGVLVVGVAEADKDDVPEGKARFFLDPIKAPQDEVEKGVLEAVKQLRYHIPRGVRHQYVECPDGGVVLVVAVSRSDRLVPVVEGSGETITYLRISDNTIKAPAYLVEDMVLGRRTAPDLHVSAWLEWRAYEVRHLLRLTVTNVGLGWADDPLVGLVAYRTRRDGEVPIMAEAARSVVPLNGPALFDGPPPAAYPQLVLETRRLANAKGETRFDPYEHGVVEFEVELAPISNQGPLTAFGLYVACRGSPPVWHQVVVKSYPQLNHGHHREAVMNAYNREHVIIYPCEGFRPRVGQISERANQFVKIEQTGNEPVITPTVDD